MTTPEQIRSYRYRLPSALGGGVYDGIPNSNHILLDIPTVGVVPFDATLVELVLPAEPDNGNFVTVENPGHRPNVFSRHDDPVGESADAAHWWWHDKSQWLTWENVCALGFPRRLLFASGQLSGPVKTVCLRCNELVRVRNDGRLEEHGPNRRRGCPGANTLAVQHSTGGQP